jgi:hypothetical protein
MNINELAKEAGFSITTDWMGRPSLVSIGTNGDIGLQGIQELERFAALVRADEREKVKKVLMAAHELSKPHHNYYHYIALQLDDAMEKLK